MNSYIESHRTSAYDQHDLDRGKEEGKIRPAPIASAEIDTKHDLAAVMEHRLNIYAYRRNEYVAGVHHNGNSRKEKKVGAKGNQQVTKIRIAKQ